MSRDEKGAGAGRVAPAGEKYGRILLFDPRVTRAILRAGW